jgi:acetamidase/formamidase
MAEHHLDPTMYHCKWNKDLAPALQIDSGDVVHCWTQEVTNGQIQPGDPPEALTRVDFDQLYPLAGPISVNGAEPGDVLAVDILSLKPDDWGWNGVIPGLGLLAEDFPDPYIIHWDLSDGTTTRLGEDITIPLQPFCGTMGVAPSTPGDHFVLPPGNFGGNIDIRHLNEGSTLLLPIQVSGGLFSAGDCHAVQGDGEVCVTGLECPMAFSLRFQLKKGMTLESPAFYTRSAPLSRHDTEAGYFATTGVGPDLMENTKDAVRRMIDWLGEEYGLSPEDAYCLCSLTGDLKISEVVDNPNWLVSFYMPLGIFR